MLAWDDLRYVWTIARVGSLAAAARELAVEHTTVGRRLSAIESALGTRLFTRGSSGLVPTAACAALIPRLSAIAAELANIESDLAGADVRLEGRVRLTAPELISPYLAAELAAFRAAHPAIDVVIVSGDRNLDLRTEADLAIRGVPVTDGDLIAKPLIVSGVSVYAVQSYLDRRGTPASVDDLAGHDVVAYVESAQMLPGAPWMEAHLTGANVVVRAHSVPAALAAALGGAGLAALPCSVGSDPRLVRITPAVVATQPLTLVSHPDVWRLARVRALTGYVMELFTRDRALWSGVP